MDRKGYEMIYNRPPGMTQAQYKRALKLLRKHYQRKKLRAILKKRDK